MHGLIGKMRAVSGKRSELVDILAGSTGSMPGCISYVVALDLTDDDVLWITEVWQDEASHKASLDLPAVQEAIRRAKPIIAGFDQHIPTRPVSIA